MLNSAGLVDQILNYDTEIKDKDISNAEQANKILRDLDILCGLPF